MTQHTYRPQTKIGRCQTRAFISNGAAPDLSPAEWEEHVRESFEDTFDYDDYEIETTEHNGQIQGIDATVTVHGVTDITIELSNWSIDTVRQAATELTD